MLLQKSADPHALPHAPQSASVSSVLHVPLQQAPPDPHVTPQAPQLFGSASVGMHWWLQQLSPVVHSASVSQPGTHAWLLQTWPVGQSVSCVHSAWLIAGASAITGAASMAASVGPEPFPDEQAVTTKTVASVPTSARTTRARSKRLATAKSAYGGRRAALIVTRASRRLLELPGQPTLRASR
jgi:hypothetical protein